MTTSAPPTPAPAAATPSDTERFRVVIPPEIADMLREGGDLEDLEPAALPEVPASPAAPAPVAPAPAPAVTAAPVAPAPATPASPVDPRVARAEEVWSRVEESVRHARGTRQSGPLSSSELSDEEWTKFMAGAKEEVGATDDFGAAAEKIFARLRQYDKLRAERERTQRAVLRLEILQEEARSRYPDFDQMLTDAGLWGDGVPDESGTIRNPTLARQIYSDSNPPDAAYWVAVGRVATKQGKSVRDFMADRGRPAPAPASPAPAVPVVSAPVVAPPEPARGVAAHPGEPPREGVVEAARRATAETLDTMARNSSRPRGMRSLEPAGEPQQLWSFAQLQALMDRNSDAFLKLVETNPGLDEWFMNGGRPSR